VDVLLSGAPLFVVCMLKYPVDEFGWNLTAPAG
jgi:hypothetical protein